MAVITLHPMFQGISGSLGEIVHYTVNGQQYARRKVIPFDPRTPSQIARRRSFAAGVHSWQRMSSSEQQRWNKAARLKRRRGYHYYLSCFLRGTLDPAMNPSSSTNSAVITQEPLTAFFGDSQAASLAPRHSIIQLQLAENRGLRPPFY